MNRILFFVFLILVITITFSQGKYDIQSRPYLPAYLNYDKIYHGAEALSLRPDYNEETEKQESRMNEQALQGFSIILPAIEKAGDDSLAFHCWFRIATLYHYFDSLGSAQQAYQKAIALKSKLPLLADSFLFKPYVFSGGIYYSTNEFDSALSNYKKAEKIAALYPSPLSGAHRLYNTLGALYYETGNYRQAKNYFEKAIATLPLKESSYKDLLINYKINIASLLVKLEDYSGAQSVYESILPYDLFADEINHNLGIISLRRKDYKSAIASFKKVNYKNSGKIIDLYYNLGVAWSGLKEKDSSGFYIQQALAENSKWNGRRKNVPHGVLLRFQADELVNQKEYKKAIEAYQQAIMQFDASFNEPDFNKNPSSFSAVFSYINLFNTLVAKADAIELLFGEQKETNLLQASLDAYSAAFNLADYVEKTYNSDEARLFLGKLKYTVHNKPIDISLQLYDITGERQYLEKAYTFDQQNKASILSLNVFESELKRNNPADKELIAEETAVKTAITRMLLKLSRTTDSLQAQSLHSSIRDHEIQLEKLQEKIKEDPNYRNRYFITQIPSIASLQKKLDQRTAILSYHLSADEFVVLLITSKQFIPYRGKTGNDFFILTDSLKKILHEENTYGRYNGKEIAQSMYKELIAPLEPKLSQIDRLVIIPDDELNYLPFEALQDSKGNYLVEKFSIQYQYSTALWNTEDRKKIKRSSGVLAFAPFVSNGYNDSTGAGFSSLPASKEETGDLEGKILTDSLAVKNKFLSLANQYDIVHLATHAGVDNEMPLRSYIAFYPGRNNAPDNYMLYAQEIYDMDLDSTNLIILSACETGSGKLIKGEGLMSLSRAFAYAGCPNIITSLWKAEDRTTAFITQRLHYYLAKGRTKDKALQQAKIDLLKDKNTDPRFKKPSYWAHLIFIGNYEPDHPRSNWWKIALAIIIITSVYVITKKARSK
ncbi:MAG: CHAT domain-containing protein [Chitinophagaceae bacterium]|nr:CHAT domain-containing protein [Chitinophagaceae bacterium]